MKQPSVNIKNKRATFDYELMDTYTAGIVLTGTEIKSIRLGKASLVDTFCYFAKGELWVKNMHIAEYFYGSYNNHIRFLSSFTQLSHSLRFSSQLLFSCSASFSN